MTRLLLPALFLLLGPAAAAEETVAFKLSPPAGKLKLADTFIVKVEASFPQHYSLRPDTAALDTGSFELLSFTKTGESAKDGLKTENFDIKAQAFSLGVSTFPEVAWALYANGEASAKAASPQFLLTIDPAFEKTGKDEGIRDIYPPIAFVPWLWVILGALAAALVLYLLYRKYRARGVLVAAARAWTDGRSPYQRARDRLDRLEASPLAAKSLPKEFYIGLTSILRLYLGEEFLIDAELMTTADLARELKKTGADIKTTLRTREFLQKADLVKFAKLIPESAAEDAAELRDLLMEFTRAADRAKALAAEAAAEKARLARVGK
ncbi:MAG TPA: hypothetical protein DCZ92_04245 [Elusimicrobia bacterium]|nr:hypothetical protein [Elusimicrobiota bacterium]